VLVVEQWRSRDDSRPLWIALAAYALASALAPAHALAIAIALCLLAGLLVERGPVSPPAEPRP
jgi:predicted branched-subunit amino acid permease